MVTFIINAYRYIASRHGEEKISYISGDKEMEELRYTLECSITKWTTDYFTAYA